MKAAAVVARTQIPVSSFMDFWFISIQNGDAPECYGDYPAPL